jgi:alpha-tubulin suppressor-like RCC1 family protein
LKRCVAANRAQPITSDPLSLARIDGPWGKDKIVQVTAGLTFSLFLTSKGQVYACGSCEHGQLGSGTTGERIVKGNKLAYDAQTPPRKWCA